ncbi:hypothetical protein HDV04_006254 [Boothiomyces sp. JEL0838]|nr:hypothetical protein HDV04_006254 [Boothiomyces sp. JEL0838]
MTGLLMTLIDPYLQYILDTIGEVIQHIPDKPFLKTSLKCKKCFLALTECSHRYTHILSIINPKTVNSHAIQKPVKNQYYGQSKYFYDQMFKLIELKYHEYSKTNKNQVKLGNIQKQFLRKCPPFCYYCQYCGETERGYQKPKHKQNCKLYAPIRLLSELVWSDFRSTPTSFTVYQSEKYFEITGDYKKRYAMMDMGLATNVLNELIVKETTFDPSKNELCVLFEPGSGLDFKFGIRNKSWLFEKPKLMVKPDLKLYDMKNKVGNCIGVFVDGVLETGEAAVGSPLTPTSEQEHELPSPSRANESFFQHHSQAQDVSVETRNEKQFKRIKIEYLLNHDEDVNLLLNFSRNS